MVSLASKDVYSYMELFSPALKFLEPGGCDIKQQCLLQYTPKKLQDIVLWLTVQIYKEGTQDWHASI